MKIVRAVNFEDDLKKAKINQVVQRLFQPHIDSFNNFIDEGLSGIATSINPIEFEIDSSLRVKFYFHNFNLAIPSLNSGMTICYPSESRVSGTTYKSNLIATIGWAINDIEQPPISRLLSQIPIMVKSKRCALQSLSPFELVKVHEEANECGGYFICKGIERMLRLIIAQRRNYPISIARTTWKNKATGLTENGVCIRCVNSFEDCVVNVLHYGTNSTFLLSTTYQKQQYYIPFMIALRMLVNFSDYHIYCDIIRTNKESSQWRESVKAMLAIMHNSGISNLSDAKEYVGKAFRVKLGIPDWKSDSYAADYLIKYCLLIHLDNNTDKYNLLIFMAHKLMSLVDEKSAIESVDSLNNHEVLLPGQIYKMVLKDKLESWLLALKYRITSIYKATEGVVKSLTPAVINTAMARCPDIGLQMEYFMKSGNITSKKGLGIPQASGFSVIADKLNYMRYISHFRSLHRGAYFTHSYTTKVRKLLPECWGFMCPVHTPDGAPCGLLNHLTASCEITCSFTDPTEYIEHMVHFGVIFPIPGLEIDPNLITIHINGRFLGYISEENSKYLLEKLRSLKVKRKDSIEITLIPKTGLASVYPGIYIFTTPCRLMRPVINLSHRCIEKIGSFEQVYLNISIIEKDIKKKTTHLEMDPCSIFDITSSLTPFSDYNQSPRNMYQCQMMKQSMGVSLHSLKYRFDNKLYRLLNVQSPLTQNSNYAKISLDDYPIGLNAVIAVISYTGYDMEDAMILNKATIDRGFGMACVYKSAMVDLIEEASKEGSSRILAFGCSEADSHYLEKRLELDGLPAIGSYMTEGSPFYSYYDVHSGLYTLKKYRYSEPAYIDDIAIIGSSDGGNFINRVNIRLRITRNPIVGDKFSSRHGQKGVLSIQWAAEDMPFSESGIIPDIIFNPHGFPSRMTVGMMIETMSSKLGAITGEFQDGTPFQDKTIPVVEYFGHLLTKAGYNYYGNERLYSGTNGVELEVSIFTGIVYYQRLRHMVSDKFQVRNSGPVDALTHQPVGGRNKGGGVRFGEMERDGLISHGCSYLLQDRLLNCSDKSLAFICSKCGDLLSVSIDPKRIFDDKINIKPALIMDNKNPQQYICRLCDSSAHIRKLYIPYVFRYLLVELASMNIQLKLNIE